jgi:predicted branched-subunit amino acid permease
VAVSRAIPAERTEEAGSATRTEFTAGARAVMPMMAAYVPFGLVVGAAVAASDAPRAAWLGTWVIYGGAAHLAVLDVVAQGSGWAAAAAVGLLVNLRLAAYAAAMAPDWRTAPLWQRVLAAMLLTDAPWALARGRATTGRRPFYFGAAAVLLVGWPTLVTLGALLGSGLTAKPVVALLAPITLGAVVASQLSQRPAAAAVAASAVTALITASLPAGTAIVACAFVGVVAGLAAERLS